MSYDPMNPRARERDQQQDARAKQLAREQLALDVQWLMADPRGRRLMTAWLAFTGVDRTTFDGTSRSYFNEGARNVGLMLKAHRSLTTRLRITS